MMDTINRIEIEKFTQTFEKTDSKADKCNHQSRLRKSHTA